MIEKLERLKSKSILFLEDNIEFATNTTVLFDVFVRKVYHATTIQEAKILLNDYPIDIIITDIKLKNENGLDFIQSIRKTNHTIPIIVLSGHKDENFLLRSIPLNLTAYLLKPIKYEELIDTFVMCSEKMSFSDEPIVELKESWNFDAEKKVLLKEGLSFTLNKKETLFIEMVALNKDRLITKEMFQTFVWREDEMSDSALTNFIMRIRRRFGKDFIYTIPDLGYRFKL